MGNIARENEKNDIDKIEHLSYFDLYIGRIHINLLLFMLY